MKESPRPSKNREAKWRNNDKEEGMHHRDSESNPTSRAARKKTVQAHTTDGLTHHFTFATNIVFRTRTTLPKGSTHHGTTPRHREGTTES
jgi:hypothetical protein